MLSRLSRAGKSGPAWGSKFTMPIFHTANEPDQVSLTRLQHCPSCRDGLCLTLGPVRGTMAGINPEGMIEMSKTSCMCYAHSACFISQSKLVRFICGQQSNQFSNQSTCHILLASSGPLISQLNYVIINFIMSIAQSTNFPLQDIPIYLSQLMQRRTHALTSFASRSECHGVSDCVKPHLRNPDTVHPTAMEDLRTLCGQH